MQHRRLLMLGALISVTACDSSTDVDSVDAQLDATKQATAAFTSVSAAQAAGYTVWSPDPAAAGATCATNAAGKMGYHLVNPALRGSPATPAQGDAVIDYRQPEMLLYEKTSNGQMRLVGVEYIVFKEAWERVNGATAAAPKVFGEPLLLSSHSFVPGGAEIPHYELHVWLHKENPTGMFAPWHPGITC